MNQIRFEGHFARDLTVAKAKKWLGRLLKARVTGFSVMPDVDRMYRARIPATLRALRRRIARNQDYGTRWYTLR